MNLLIDTGAFISWTTRPEKLPACAFDAIRSADNTLYLSVVSPWEMQIKFMLNKLELRQPPSPLVQTELDNGAFMLLPITLPTSPRSRDCRTIIATHSIAYSSRKRSARI